MNKLFLCFVLMSFVSCSSLTPNYSSLPQEATAAQKRDALIQDARIKLSDPNFQEASQNALVLAGQISLAALKANGASDAEIRDYKDQMFSWAKMFDDLSTGKIYTSVELSALASKYGINIDAAKNDQFVLAGNSLIGVIRPLLASVDDIQLTIRWMQIAANAARTVGGS